jgi:hypothetical protein
VIFVIDSNGLDSTLTIDASTSFTNSTVSHYVSSEEALGGSLYLNNAGLELLLDGIIVTTTKSSDTGGFIFNEASKKI